METTQVPINRWMDKEEVVCMYVCVYVCVCVCVCVYTCTHIMEYSCHKKEWNSSNCSHVNGPRGYYAQWKKSDKERQILYDTTYMWNLKNNINECICKTETRMVVVRGWGWADVGQTVQTSNYRMNKFCMYSMVTIVNNTVFCSGKLLREE